ncbi:hypothetical protein MJO29_011142 [Puccinia striiformis f. sp. tritici]|nr:hypothetical protein MJO29_011142 [Puccinia striiformis f. sp. tritici]
MLPPQKASSSTCRHFKFLRMARRSSAAQGRNNRVAPLRTVAQITRAYAAERAATTQSTENVDVAPSPQRLSSSLATARRRGSTNTTRTRSPPTRHSRRRQIDGNRDESESVASATPTPVPTTRRAQRQAPWTILSNINRPAALAQVANNEADIIQRFPGEIPNYQGLMDDPCESCGSLHWRGERTLNDRRKLRASYTICCHKGKSILPIQYDEIEYPEVLKRRLVGTGSVSRMFQEQLRAYNNALSLELHLNLY